MWLFKRKKRAKEFAEKEAEIQAIKANTYQKIDEATKSTRKLGKLLENESIAEMISNATGAGRRR